MTRYEQEFNVKFNKNDAGLEGGEAVPERTLVDKELDGLA